MRSLVTSVAALVLLNLVFASPVHSGATKAQPGANAKPENMEIRDKWAIAIGVNRFSDSSIPSLKFAQKSSADLARALKDPDYGHFGQNHVIVLNGPEANKSTIDQAFEEWLFKKAMPEDLVVIYINSRLLKNSAGDAILCANDTQANAPDKTGIDLVQLLTNARQRVGSTHMICLLDTSPAETTANESSKNAHDLKWLATTSGMAVFSAAELFKPSLDDTTDMQSYFSHFFVEALKTGGANYPVAMIAEYVWQKLQETTKTASSAGQTAVLSLASEKSGTVAIPIGIMVRSSLPPKNTVSIGHSLDTLAFDRPDMIAPTMNPSRSAVHLMPRTREAATTASQTAQSATLGVTTAPQTAPSVAAEATTTPQTARSKTPATNEKPKGPVKNSMLATAPLNGTKNVSQAVGGLAQQSVEDNDEEDDNVDPNLDLRPYVAKIKQVIQKKWQLPKGLESKKVTTTFSIMRNGTIENATIVESSGNAAIDESALAALKSASPLEPLPKGSPGSVDIKYAFDWNTRVGNH